MPSRVLRDGILSSERVNSLNREQEVFYRRLMSVIDDFGRFDARPSILRAALYPLCLDQETEQDIESYLEAVSRQCLIRLYKVDGKPYLQLHDFRQHIRAKESKWPAPEPETHNTCTATAQHPRTDTLEDGVGVVDGIEDGVDARAARPLCVPGLHESDRWEVEVAFGNARKAGYDPEEINQTLTDFVRKGKKLTNLTNYLIKTLQGKRETLSNGKAPPIQPKTPTKYVTIPPGMETR